MGGWNFEDLTGKSFGRYVVILRTKSRGGKKGNKDSYYLCRCACGVEKEVAAKALRKGDVKSCGCLAKDNVSKRNTKHSLADHPLFAVWLRMRARCRKGINGYHNRGIRVCQEWDSDFIAFYKWALDNGWDSDKNISRSNMLTIERIDVNGDYCPENCKWALPLEQSNNKTNTVKVDILGETMPFSEAVRKYSLLSRELVYSRYKKGWKIEEALMYPKYSPYSLFWDRRGRSNQVEKELYE